MRAAAVHRARRAEGATAALVTEVLAGGPPRELPAPVTQALALLEQARRAPALTAR